MDASRLDVVMHEYDAVKDEIQTALSNQVSVLSFGAAAVGLLVAAGAALWDEVVELSIVIFVVVVPLDCLLTLLVYMTEQVRVMRAGCFIRRMEIDVGTVVGTPQLLLWEHWDIRRGLRDVDRVARWAVTAVFVLLGGIFALLGLQQMGTRTGTELPGWAAVGFLVLTTVLLLWILFLGWVAREYRRAYERMA